MRILKRTLHLSVILLTAAALFGCERRTGVKIKKVKVNDIEIAYYTRGSGDPLVMIMGFRGTMAAWDPDLLEILEKKFTLILFDNRGAGLSTDTQNDQTTISQMAKDTAQLIKALGYKKANVLGWSMGSRIAEILAIDHPELVENLILCSPNPGGKHQAVRKTNNYIKLTKPILSIEDILSLIFPDTTEGHKAAVSYIIRLTKAITLGAVPNDLNVSEQTVERQVNALNLWEQDNQSFEALKSIKAPTLVTGGLSDALDQPENVQLVANQIPFAWMAYFAGAGHNFLSQDYEYFAELVTLFIESNSSNKHPF